MKEICYPTLGETWLAALRALYHEGEVVGDEFREVLSLSVSFKTGDFEEDALLVRLGSRDVVEQMRKVFFSGEPNRFGHSYFDRFRGPQGRSDFGDVTELLRCEPFSKRAVVTLAELGNGKVPCINAIHFLRRREGLVANYFSRGQDMFRKFYADGVCLYEITKRVASALDMPVVSVTGSISSAHIYLKDMEEIRELLDQVDRTGEPSFLPEGVA